MMVCVSLMFVVKYTVIQGQVPSINVQDHAMHNNIIQLYTIRKQYRNNNIQRKNFNTGIHRPETDDTTIRSGGMRKYIKKHPIYNIVSELWTLPLVYILGTRVMSKSSRRPYNKPNSEERNNKAGRRPKSSNKRKKSHLGSKSVKIEHLDLEQHGQSG